MGIKRKKVCTPLLGDGGDRLVSTITDKDEIEKGTTSEGIYYITK